MADAPPDLHDPSVVRRSPVSLFFRLVPENKLKTPVYHQVRAANAARQWRNMAA